jgi:hypothetical protein
LAAEKLNMDFKQAKAIPPEQRGTLLADVLELASPIRAKHGEVRQAALFEKQSQAELDLQKKLKVKFNLDLDFYHRIYK